MYFKVQLVMCLNFLSEEEVVELTDKLEPRLKQFLDSGETAIGGRMPVNVSGGLLSKGHPLGATGIANIYEIATHLRGEAGARQVKNAKIGMTHVVGLGSACAIHILEKAG